MFLKTFAIAAPVLLGGMYVTGALGGGAWSRDVAHPQAEVMRALEDLDIREQPGSPGTDPARSGGVMPLFNLERTDNSMRWKVMSGDKVAVTMIADFKPSADGQKTHVTAHVERGDAPDDFVSPALRSKGLALALFSMALEGELNELTMPAPGDPETCAKLLERFQDANMEAGAQRRPDSLKSAIGQVAATGVRLSAFEAEQRRLGCQHHDGGSDFRPPESSMGSADAPGSSSGRGGSSGSVSFTPGQPMIDPTPPGERRR